MSAWLKMSGVQGSDKLDVYFTELARILNSFETRALKVLEIGTQRGGNLVFLGNFLAEDSKIVGIDIHDPIFPLPENVTFIKGDSTKSATVDQVFKLGPFDLIIEDASHIQSDVIKNVKIYSKMLSKNGYMMIEDTQYGILNGWGRGFKGSNSFAQYYINEMYPATLFPQNGIDAFNAYFAPYSITITRSEVLEIRRIDSRSGKNLIMRKPNKTELFKKWLYLKYEQQKPVVIFPLLKLIYKIRDKKFN